MGLSMRELSRRKYAPSADWLERRAAAANFKACAARFAQRLVLRLSTFPPVILVPGPRSNHDAKYLSLGNLLMSMPVSECTHPLRSALALKTTKRWHGLDAAPSPKKSFLTRSTLCWTPKRHTLHGFRKRWQVAFDHQPDCIEIDAQVAMNNDVAKTDRKSVV